MNISPRGGYETLRPGTALAGSYGNAASHKDEAKLSLKWRVDAVEANQKVSREKADNEPSLANLPAHPPELNKRPMPTSV